MPVKVTAQIHAVLSRQDLSSDDVSYEIEIDVLGVPLRVECPAALIERIDQMLSAPQQPLQQPTRKGRSQPNPRAQEELSGYDVGVLEDYDVEDNV